MGRSFGAQIVITLAVAACGKELTAADTPEAGDAGSTSDGATSTPDGGGGGGGGCGGRNIALCADFDGQDRGTLYLEGVPTPGLSYVGNGEGEEPTLTEGGVSAPNAAVASLPKLAAATGDHASYVSAALRSDVAAARLSFAIRIDTLPATGRVQIAIASVGTLRVVWTIEDQAGRVDVYDGATALSQKSFPVPVAGSWRKVEIVIDRPNKQVVLKQDAFDAVLVDLPVVSAAPGVAQIVAGLFSNWNVDPTVVRYDDLVIQQ